MSFCSNCGFSLAEDTKFCPNCGNAVNAVPVAAAQQPAEQVNVQPEQPVFVQPQAPVQNIPQNPVYVQPVSYTVVQEERPKGGMGMPITAIVFAALTLFFFVLTGEFISEFEWDAVAGGAAFTFIFAIIAQPFSVVGLVKSIKARKVAGIILSAIALFISVVFFFATVGVMETLS